MTDSGDGALHEKPRIILKPVIQEIVRTRFFGNPIKLLVDRIHVVPYKSDRDESEAYRLRMSDTEKVIQAVLKPEIHPYLNSREVRDGSVVLVNKYRLELADRRNGNGQVLYLVIEDMEPVGFDGRESVGFTFEEARIEPKTPSKGGSALRNVIFPSLNSSDETPSGEPAESPQKKVELGHKRPFDDLSPSPSPSEPKAKKSLLKDPETAATTIHTRPKTASGPFNQTSRYGIFSRPKTQPSPNSRRTDSKSPPSAQDAIRPISRPLSLTPLAKITGPPQTLMRNRIVDVLVVIAEVSPNIIARSHSAHLDLPPSRNLRIIDPSTSKKVQLTVFVDAEEFLPEVGTVALFRSVTTHEWDGGSLKAYPRDCKGRQWFTPWPWGMEGCDVKALKNWWEARTLAGL